MKKFLRHFKTAFIFTIVMTLICGFIYPLVLTGVSQVLLPSQANGSIEEVNGKAVGSSIVGQDFTDERLFHCRPSAYSYNTYTEEQKDNGDYAGVSSGSNNYANSNPDLKARIEEDIVKFLEENPTVQKEDIPADMITASGSGLDPHISIESAKVQLDRISDKTGVSKDTLQIMIDNNTSHKFLGIFGEDTVNVLTLNLEVAKEINMIK